MAQERSETRETGIMTQFTTPELTRREYFAAVAMQGMLANPEMLLSCDEDESKRIAADALVMADALIEALSGARDADTGEPLPRYL
jgi:hypothetical protein